jgi:hypothetical protein
MVLGPRDARRQVGEDEVVPAVMRDQPVGGGEVDADRFHSSSLTWPSSDGISTEASGLTLVHARG